MARPLVLGVAAFAVYSFKANYMPQADASPAQETTAKQRSKEKPKPKQIVKPVPKQVPEPGHNATSCISPGGDSMQCAIDTFFGKPAKPVTVDLGANASAVRFVIATLPDPIHTDLALSFDRFLESIIQGAQESGYTFDRAVLPWSVSTEQSQEPKSDDANAASPVPARPDKENSPGLLIFRNVKARETPTAKHLFVLLVGETPTSGINKEQFGRALNIIHPRTSEAPQRIDILGPTFSGSLYSLRVLEDQANVHGNLTFRIRSGAVMSGDAIDSFQKRAMHQDFLSFKETDSYLIDRFVDFIEHENGHEGYKEKDVAVISEDETALGHRQAESPTDQHPDLLYIYFPRGIAQLRTAYQNDSVLSAGKEEANAPHSKLKLDLDSTGSDDDGIPTYAGGQTAVSQEAVMMGIVTVLRTHPHRFLILRATDPKDLLFLTQFLRTNFPQDRIITMGADQLFPRDINDTIFRGVLSLTNYPLLPVQLTDFDSPRAHRVFSSTESAGLFNATLDILNEGDNESAQGGLPQEPYFEYTQPRFEGEPGGVTKEKLSPLAWLTVMGDDGYWPLATLPPPKKDGTLSSSLRHIALPDPAPQKAAPPDPAPPDLLPKPISLRPSQLNGLMIEGLLVLSLAFIFLTWLGDFKSRSTVQQEFSMLTDRTRGRLLALISVLLIVGFVLLGSPISEKNLWFPSLVIVGALGVAISAVWNLLARNQKWTALTVVLLAFMLAFPLGWISRSHHSINQDLLLYRMAWLQSGVSPTLPLLLVCAAFFAWAWFNLKLRSLFDLRRPVLPRGVPMLPAADQYDEEEYARVFTRSWPFWIIAFLVIAVFVIRDIDPLSLDGSNFNDLYRTFFLAGVILVANSMFIAWSTWKKCRALLLQIDRTPLRWAFGRIEGFSWKPLWGMAGGDLMSAYKPLSRSYEAFTHLRSSLDADQLKAQLNYVQGRGGLLDKELLYLRDEFAHPRKARRSGQLLRVHNELLYRIHVLQKNLALMSSLVWFAVLEKFWKTDTRSVTTGRQICAPSRSSMQKDGSDSSGAGESSAEDNCVKNETQSTRLAEEFISLIYLNFIHRVLLRLRWLILAATSAYVLLLFSAKLYPFEPHGQINGLLIMLFLSIAVVVYLIYSEMHRDATLSNLTKTTPGALGSDFWIHLITIGAVPVFSLLATQVPTLSRFFFQWMKPLLDGVHPS